MYKNHKKVAFNIASEASYVYILSGQKLLKNSILASFWKLDAWGQTVLPDRSILIGQKLVENAKIEKFNWTKIEEKWKLLLTQPLHIIFELCQFCPIKNELSGNTIWQ